MVDQIKLAIFYAIHRFTGAFNNPFSDIPKKPLWHKKLNTLPEPVVRYVIFFTPRSGSSRLTDLLENAGGCGIPGEYFNPKHVKRAATFLGAQGLEDYINLLMRRKNTNGVFGCELTSSHIYSLFFSDKRFLRLIQPTSSVFLIRENIIEQAVSLSRMIQTGVAHDTSSAGLSTDDIEFQYRPAQIRSNLLRLLSMERQLERMFHLNNMEPLRLSYESLTRISPDKFIPVIADHVGGTCEKHACLKSKHKKIGDEINLEYVQQFSRDNSKLIEKVNNRRIHTLSALYEQQVRYYPES
jgi:LPS sulfotransferase NodH